MLPMFGIDPTLEYNRFELGQLLDQLDIDSNTFSAPAVGQAVTDLMTTEAKIRLDVLRKVVSVAEEDFTDPRSLPEVYRRMFRNEIILPLLISKDMSITQYRQLLQDDWGDPFWEAIQPLNLSEVPQGATDNTLRITVDPAFVEIVDGDTLAVEFFRPDQLVSFANADVNPEQLEPEAVQRVRLMGINAEEKNRVAQREYETALTQWQADGSRGTSPVKPNFLLQDENLRAAIKTAETIDLVMVREIDGIQLPVDQKIEGNTRWIMWLYIDGVQQFDPSVFSERNPSGAGVGGSGIPTGVTDG